jgi:hypothetical protein
MKIRKAEKKRISLLMKGKAVISGVNLQDKERGFFHNSPRD